ncbi:MAG: hypothetical protein CVU52_09635 [Deltaproteobacteria bacterium HGW-Deltaproteobacteria-10]|nr:MAG: hypothetical protein CVU52_09635 [Deltaproteobacteria bacterium HGW-Deltaproteobacteria-10]
MKKLGVALLLILCIMAVSGLDFCYAKPSVSMVIRIYVSAQGKQLSALFDLSSEKVILELPDGKTLTLPDAKPASGTRYSDGKTTFLVHQRNAKLFRGDTVLFEGKETGAASGDLAGKEKPPASTVDPVYDAALLREAITNYASYLKYGDKNYGAKYNNDGFPCKLDAGNELPPVETHCTNIFSRTITNGDWASAIFVPVPVVAMYKEMPIIGGDKVYFLLQRGPYGEWRGVHWSLSPGAPVLGRKKMQEIGISGQVLTALGWKAEK